MKHKKPCWVKVHDLYKLTVWNNSNEVRKARRKGLVEYRKLDGIDYKIESIHPVFLKQQSA